MIKIEMDETKQPVVRRSHFSETKEYTYDPKCCPQRVVEIRDVINKIDEQIEEQINQVKSQINEAIENETVNLRIIKRAGESFWLKVLDMPKNLVRMLKQKTF